MKTTRGQNVHLIRNVFLRHHLAKKILEYFNLENKLLPMIEYKYSRVNGDVIYYAFSHTCTSIHWFRHTWFKHVSRIRWVLIHHLYNIKPIFSYALGNYERSTPREMIIDKILPSIFPDIKRLESSLFTCTKNKKTTKIARFPVLHLKNEN